MTNSKHANLAASVRDRLFNLSKTRGEAFDLTLTRYALERFLYRLSQSEHKSRLILKGAMLFELWSQQPHRATRDLDLLASGDVTTDTIAQSIQEIIETEVVDDGLDFKLANLKVEQIREETEYGGIRARFTAQLGTARINLQVDFGVGDAVTPAPTETEYPTLLDMPAPSVFAYPQETVIAEKLEAIVNLGLANSRMKDYHDLWFFTTTFKFDTALLGEAIQRTFKRRGQTIPTELPEGLSNAFAEDPQKQAQWRAFQERIAGAELGLDAVVASIREFAMPLFETAHQE